MYIPPIPNAAREQFNLKPITLCNREGHKYTTVYHDKISHRTYLVCTRCGKGVIVDKFEYLEE